MKYCPLCDAEYAVGRGRCTVCGVDLVPEELRGRPLDERQRNERIQVVWRGGDPLAVSEVIETLRDLGIRHHVQPTNEHMVFELGMPRPNDDTEVEVESATQPDRPKRDWNRAAATVEIWNGEDAALADLLEACLRENQIGVRREGTNPGPLRFLVMPADEVSAREIIREVREATPPA
jgi:hypothetical protein